MALNQRNQIMCSALMILTVVLVTVGVVLFFIGQQLSFQKQTIDPVNKKHLLQKTKSLNFFDGISDLEEKLEIEQLVKKSEELREQIVLQEEKKSRKSRTIKKWILSELEKGHEVHRLKKEHEYLDAEMALIAAIKRQDEEAFLTAIAEA